MEELKNCLKCNMDKPLKSFDNRKECHACRYAERKEYMHTYYKKTYIPRPTPRIRRKKIINIENLENVKPKRKYIKKIKDIENPEILKPKRKYIKKIKDIENPEIVKPKRKYERKIKDIVIV
jgi:hypothetical protein